MSTAGQATGEEGRVENPRTARSGFWSARRRALAACLIGLGIVIFAALVMAQKTLRDKNAVNPGDQKVVSNQKPSLAVYLSVLPGKQQSELEFRVRTEPPVKNPPEVEFQDMSGGTVRTLKIEADAKSTSWVGTITKIEPFGVGYIHVIATDDSGVAQRHAIRYATRGTVKDQPNVVYSVDGQFAFVALAGEVPADTRFLVSTLEMPETPLPEGVKLRAGPFQIVGMQPTPDQIKASIAIFLGGTSPNASPAPTYQLRWLKPAGRDWDVLPTIIAPDGRNAQATVAGLGMFVLTSESK